MNTLKKVIASLLLGVVLTIYPTSIYAQTNASASALAEAQILEVKDTGKVNTQNHAPIGAVTLKILSGGQKDRVFTIEDNTIALPMQIHYKKGNRVIVTISSDSKNHL